MDEPKISTALILVVEDDVRSARVLVRMLRDDGYEVELATDGAAAISRLSRSPLPDVLVTDLRMPHADGQSVARYARNLGPDMPIWVVTGYPDLASKLENDATILTKPLDYEQLRNNIRDRLTAAGKPSR